MLKKACELIQPLAFRVARLKKFELALKANTQSPGASVRWPSVSPDPTVTLPPPISRSKEALSVITSRMSMLPSTCRRKERAGMTSPLVVVRSAPVVLIRRSPLPWILMMSKRLKFTPMVSSSTRPGFGSFSS